MHSSRIHLDMDEFNETATNDLLHLLDLYPDFKSFLIEYNLNK